MSYVKQFCAKYAKAIVGMITIGAVDIAGHYGLNLDPAFLTAFSVVAVGFMVGWVPNSDPASGN